MFDPDGPVLGVDPGLTRCGYGAVRPGATGPVAVAYGVLRTEPSDELPHRLATLHDDLQALLADLRPSALAVERLLFQHNVRTAMAVGQASGVVLTVAAHAGVPVTHYSPNEVKLGVAGDGGADKAQVQHMVARVLQLDAASRAARRGRRARARAVPCLARAAPGGGRRGGARDRDRRPTRSRDRAGAGPG